MTVFKEINAYSTSMVGEWGTFTVGETVDSPPHAPWVCLLSTLAMSPSSHLKTVILEYSQNSILKLNT